MSDLAIVVDPRSQVDPGSFGAAVDGANLTVPAELHLILRRYDIRTARDFVSFLHASPSGLAAELGWGLEGVRRATSGLLGMLKDILPQNSLQPPPAPRFARGARRPA